MPYHEFMRIGISGSSGFIGSHACDSILRAGDAPVSVQRGFPLPPCDVLIHIAALAHQTASLEELMEANCELTLRLAAEAREAGVKRFVFVSSIGVVAGSETQPLTSDAEYRPINNYGISKAEAEKKLLELQGIEIVVLRPPLVYGPRAKGSMATLMRLCSSGIPLPFSAVRNRRSMVGVSNLCSALHFLCRADVAGQIFHIEDGQYSLSAIISDCREAMGMSRRLFYAPPSIIAGTLRALGRGGVAKQLMDDLLVDDTSLHRAGWQPAQTEDMARMAREALV
jgi:UDP-glucose 4-epimerase